MTYINKEFLIKHINKTFIRVGYYVVYAIGAIKINRFDDVYDAIKIGVSSDASMIQRLKVVQTSSHNNLRIIRAVRVDNEKLAYILEKYIHKKFSKSRIRGEWFFATEEIKSFLYREMSDYGHIAIKTYPSFEAIKERLVKDA